MQAIAASPDFRLSSGGVMFTLLRRAGLVTDSEYRFRRRIATLIAVAWLPMVLFALFEGTLFGDENTLGFLADYKPHVRCLFSLPLLVLADIIIDPVVNSALSSFRSSGILPESARPDFEQAATALQRRRDSSLPDLVILALSVLLIWSYTSGIADVGVEDDTVSWLLAADGEGLTMAGNWYLFVTTPLLQILLFRWLYRFLIWSAFLLSFSRMDLTLEPTHPDGAGGLGMLSSTQGAFTTIFIAVGALLSASLAQEILYTDFTLGEARPIIGSFVLAAIAITSLPLLFFVPKLVRTRRRGRRVYGALGHKLTRAFDERWADKPDPGIGEDMLGAMDPSAMADYTAVFENVKGTRVIPAGLHSFVLQAALLAAPFLPLALLEWPLTELVDRLIGSLV